MAKPVSPSNVTIMHNDSLILRVVPCAFEEKPTSQQGDLQSLNTDVGSIVVPEICSNAIDDQACEEAIEVKEKEDGAAD